MFTLHSCRGDAKRYIKLNIGFINRLYFYSFIKDSPFSCF